MIKSRQGEIIQEDAHKPKCCNCDYSVSLDTMSDWVLCQKGAPKATYNETLGRMVGSFPLVRNNDFCGDHPHYPRTRAMEILETQVLLLREIKEAVNGTNKG